jgi:hypothetical protein
VSDLFEISLLRLMQNRPATPQQFAAQFSDSYDTNLALLAVPTPVTTGRRSLLEAALLPAFASPRAGTSDKAIRAFVQGLTVFWPGVPVPGGAVTAFTGGALLKSMLTTGLRAPRISPEQAAKRIAAAFTAATRLVQYVIPPAGPLFLVVP